MCLLASTEHCQRESDSEHSRITNGLTRIPYGTRTPYSTRTMMINLIFITNIRQHDKLINNNMCNYFFFFFINSLGTVSFSYKTYMSHSVRCMCTVHETAAEKNANTLNLLIARDTNAVSRKIYSFEQAAVSLDIFTGNRYTKVKYSNNVDTVYKYIQYTIYILYMFGDTSRDEARRRHWCRIRANHNMLY